MQIDGLFPMLKRKTFSSHVHLYPAGLPLSLLFTVKIQGHLPCRFVLFLRIFVLSIQTFLQNLHYFVVVIYLLVSAECFESPVERWTDLERTPHASAWYERRFFRSLDPEVVNLIFDTEFHDMHIFLNILGSLEFFLRII